MRIDIATLFVEMMAGVLDESILKRAQTKGCVDIHLHDIRDFSDDKHNRVDDSPYGGGYGMIIKAEPVYRCYLEVLKSVKTAPYVVYMSPQGKTLTQKKSLELAAKEHLFLLCGHYEGIDDRVLKLMVDEEISIGNYVLTGGELPALVLLDTVMRLVPGVLKSPECFENESHFNQSLEYPQYTRPQVWRDREVPEILLSGDHKKIEEYRKEAAKEVTRQKRPDLINEDKSE